MISNLITPCGYMKLVLPNPPERTTDTFGRFQYTVHRNGPATIINRGPLTKCTIASHVNDLVPLLREEVRLGKTVIFIIADGGCNFHVGHASNLLYYCRLFRDLKLDALIITSYAPGQSALNPIEHVWSPCTNALASVSLPDKLPGESICPWHQDIPEEEMAGKECKVYDQAMEELGEYLKHVEFGGFPIQLSHIPSAVTEESPYSDYNETYKVMSSNSGKVYRESHLVEEVEFMLRHVDKRIGFLSFAKCRDALCHHCQGNPIQAHDVMQHIFHDGGGFPSPVPSKDRDGHFLTFHEVMNLPAWDTDDTEMQQSLGRCSICRAYTALHSHLVVKRN
ncbi:uncharacterized protein [Antedon mediterranea]|uniref:uncharacterized protein n=1 Tax=Antedon mediterranea TaxID=105859 RepID=UPI003AF5FD08